MNNQNIIVLLNYRYKNMVKKKKKDPNDKTNKAMINMQEA